MHVFQLIKYGGLFLCRRFFYVFPHPCCCRVCRTDSKRSLAIMRIRGVKRDVPPSLVSSSRAATSSQSSSSFFFAVSWIHQMKSDERYEASNVDVVQISRRDVPICELLSCSFASSDEFFCACVLCERYIACVLFFLFILQHQEEGAASIQMMTTALFPSRLRVARVYIYTQILRDQTVVTSVFGGSCPSDLKRHFYIIPHQLMMMTMMLFFSASSSRRWPTSMGKSNKNTKREEKVIRTTVCNTGHHDQQDQQPVPPFTKKHGENS